MASRKFLVPANLLNLETDPDSGISGDIYYNTISDKLRIHDGTSWIDVGGGSSITVSSTAPQDPVIGSGWFDNVTGDFFIYDGSFWVEVNGTIENPPISQEEVQDYAAPLLNHSNHENVTATYDDVNNQIILAASGGSEIIVSPTAPPSPNIGTAWYQDTTGSLYIYDGTYWIEVNGVIENPPITQEEVQDYVAPLLNHANHTNITATYDDANNQLLLTAGAGYTDEEAVDSVATALNNGTHSNITIAYNDEQNAISIASTGNYTNVDSITTPDYITLDTTPELSSTAPGTIFWDNGEGTPAVILNSDVTLQIGQENVTLCYNGTGSTITNGSVVYISGAQGQRPSITLADADTEQTSSKVFGIVTQDILNGAEGFVATFGIVNGLNTEGLTEGAALWLSSTPGQFTSTKPAAPVHTVFVGYVLKSNASSGRVFVNPQNGYEIDELHDVLIDTPTNNEVLAYDGLSGLWKNKTASEASLVDLSSAQVLSNKTITGDLKFSSYISGLPADALISQDMDSFNIYTQYAPIIIGGGAGEFLNSNTSANQIATLGDLVGISATVTGTANEIEVSDTGTNDYVVGLPSDVVISNNLQVDGRINLLTSGSTSMAYLEAFTTGSSSVFNIVSLGDIYTGADTYTLMADSFLLGTTGSIFIGGQGEVVLDGMGGSTGIGGEYLGSIAPLNQIVKVGDLSDYAPINAPSFTGNVIIGGDLTVNGTTVTLNTETLAIEDNIITLNSSVSGTPSTNAGVEVERGTLSNVSIRWNETLDVWEYTNDGTEYLEIGSGAGTIVSATAPLDPVEGAGWFNTTNGSLYIYDGSYWVEAGGVLEAPQLTQEDVQDYVAPLLNHLNHSNIAVTYDDANNRLILSLKDGIITLNDGTVGEPTANATLKVDRGSSPDVAVRWNETNNEWEYTNDGIEYLAIGSGTGGGVSTTTALSNSFWLGA